MPIPLGIWATAGAGGAPAGAYELISTQYGNGSGSSITFSSIPSTYKHLQIRWVARESTTSTNLQWNIRFNGDSATNYSNHIILGDGGGVYAGYSINSTYIPIPYQSGSGTSGLYTSGILDLVDYASTTKNKTTRTLINGYASSSNTRIALNSGNWQSLNAVSSIAFTTASGNNFDSGSRFSLYGIKG